MEQTAVLPKRGILAKLRKRDEAALAARQARAQLLCQLKDCEARLRRNETLFNMETEDLLIDSSIYEYHALLCRHRYLVEQLKRG